MTAAELVSTVRIAEVYRALTGAQARRAGPDSWRGPAKWRGGDGLNVSMDDSRGVWRDFVTGDGGGVLDLIMRVRGGTRQDAVRWLADITGATLDCRAPSSSSRPEYAEVQRRRRDVPYFADAARFMAEGALELLSSTDPKRAAHTTLLAALRVAPEAEYRAWLDERPRWAAALVSAGRARARRLQMGLASYLFSEEANAARNPD